MGALTNAMRLQRRSSGPSSGTIEGVPAKTVVLLYTADLLEHVKSDGGVCFLRFSEVLITSDTTILKIEHSAIEVLSRYSIHFKIHDI